VGTVGDQWGQRPLFSEPGEDQPLPEQGNMGYEGRPDDIHPSDGRQSSDEVATLIADEVESAAVVLNFSTNNVSLPPTDAQITAAFGSRPVGFIGFIIDNGGSGTVILCIRSQQDNWWYEQFTKAL
jgi:hypothetical protein